jgi:hypothetical protein
MIGSLFGKLFGTEKALAGIVDGATNAIDKLVYTQEERAEDRAKAITEARSMVIAWMASTQGQNLARRLIALIVTLVWITQYLSMMVLSVVAVWVSDPEKFVTSADVIGGYAENMNGAMMLILGFYFAAPYMGDMTKSALNKFSKPAG